MLLLCDRMYIADDSATEAMLPADSICVYARLQYND